mgnify:CR=1 FL=1
MKNPSKKKSTSVVRKKSVLLPTPKVAALSMIARLPNNVSYKRIIYHFYVMHNIELGVRDFEAGRVFSHAEVRKLLNQWFKGKP